MRIFRVGTTYGELRSTGYPAFSNVRHEVNLTAMLTEGETPAEVLAKLDTYARELVKRRFGDAPSEPATDLDRPYHKPV